jgi:hypothetical protein
MVINHLNVTDYQVSHNKLYRERISCSEYEWVKMTLIVN